MLANSILFLFPVLIAEMHTWYWCSRSEVCEGESSWCYFDIYLSTFNGGAWGAPPCKVNTATEFDLISFQFFPVLVPTFNIVNRGTEAEDQILKRLRNAKEEIEQGKSSGIFDHILYNDKLEECYENLKVICYCLMQISDNLIIFLFVKYPDLTSLLCIETLGTWWEYCCNPSNL